MSNRIARVTSLMLALCYCCALHSQDLSSHQWSDRLLLILTTDTNATLYQQQLQECYKDQPGLQERRLKIYHITPDAYRLDTQQDWQSSTALFQQYQKADTGFEVILIGLDGGIKLRRSELLSLEDLFAIIDGMPMRRAELRKG